VGSFGRVYQGRWNSTDVAVKVIEHDAARAGEVENEVLLMMGLAHDNIVAAYHYVTYVRRSEAPAAGDDHVASGDGGTPAQGSGHILTSSGGRRSTNSGQMSSTVRRDSASKKKKAESHLVMEFCDCGTLAHAVSSLRQQQQGQQQEELSCQVMPEVLLLLHDVARGLQAIHSKNIVHGDLVSHFATDAVVALCCGFLGDDAIVTMSSSQPTCGTPIVCISAAVCAGFLALLVSPGWISLSQS
jgi:serine/threonine protein kinase